MSQARRGLVGKADSSWRLLLEALADPLRLRIIRLVSGCELSVGEIGKVLQLPQSTASRHLRQLSDAGLIEARSEGTATIYRVCKIQEDDGKALLSIGMARVATGGPVAEDDSRLSAVLAERRPGVEGFFGRVGKGWDSLRTQLYGDQFASEGLLALLDPTMVVADVGAGTGQLAARLAPFVRKVVAIDREAAMVEACRARLGPFANSEVRKGDILKLPARDGEFDAVLASLVFHHISDIGTAISQIARALRPGGRLMIIDMLPHNRTEYRATMDHVHLGFSASDIEAMAGGRMRFDRYTRLTPAPEAKGPCLFVAVLTTSSQPRRRRSS